MSLTDPFGLCPTQAEVYKNRALKWLHTALDVGGGFMRLESVAAQMMLDSAEG